MHNQKRPRISTAKGATTSHAIQGRRHASSHTLSAFQISATKGAVKYAHMNNALKGE